MAFMSAILLKLSWNEFRSKYCCSLCVGTIITPPGLLTLKLLRDLCLFPCLKDFELNCFWIICFEPLNIM